MTKDTGEYPEHKCDDCKHRDVADWGEPSSCDNPESDHYKHVFWRGHPACGCYEKYTIDVSGLDVLKTRIRVR